MSRGLPVGQLRAGTVRLATLDAQNVGFCYHLATIGDGHWPRLHGVPQDPQALMSRLWGDALAAFRILDRSQNWIGVASIHSPNDRHQYASFEVIGLPGADDHALEEAGELIVGYAFDVFNYRKLYNTYFECQPGRLKAEMREESRLKDAVLINGNYWARITDAIYRGDVPRDREPLARTATGTLRRVDVRLRAVTPDDSDRLRAIELSNGNLVRWRYAGQTPPPMMMDNMRNAGVLDQQAITVDGEVIGLVNANCADLQSGTAWLALVTADEYHHTGIGMQAGGMFIDRVFSDYPGLRKLYGEVNEANLADFGSLVRRGYATDQGVLRDHLLFGGQPMDVHNLCIDREPWMEKVHPRLTRWLGQTSVSR